MAGAKLAEGELEQHAGLAEARRRLEEHEGLPLELGGELGPGRFLAGAQGGKRRMEAQAAQALAGAEPQVQEFGHALELRAEKALVGGGERDGLGEPAAGLDEHEFAPKGRGTRVEGRGAQDGRGNPGEGEVTGELHEIAGVIGAQGGLVGGQRTGDGLDLAEGDRAGEVHALVDAAGQGERPAAVKDPAGDRDLELGAGCFLRGAGAELVVPVGAELRPPDPGGTAAGIMRAGGELREFAHAQAGGALVEVEFHRFTTNDTKHPEGQSRKLAATRCKGSGAAKEPPLRRLARGRFATTPWKFCAFLRQSLRGPG